MRLLGLPVRQAGAEIRVKEADAAAPGIELALKAAGPGHFKDEDRSHRAYRAPAKGLQRGLAPEIIWAICALTSILPDLYTLVAWS